MATTRAVGGTIDAPPLATAPFGVINPLTLQEDVIRWEGGVSFESLACAAKADLVPLCPGEFNEDLLPVTDGVGNDRMVSAPSFGITATDTCTSVGGADPRPRATDRVLQLLEAVTPKAVEHALKWGGIAANSTPPGRWLASPETTVLDSTGLCPMGAVALLLEAYAACGHGGPGVLHLTPGAATALGASLVLDGDILRMPTGAQVIVGSGYVGNPSGDPQWDGSWAFVTGPVYVWLGEPEVLPDTLERAVHVATNDIFLKAERLAAATFDGCCAFAAKVDLARIC